MTRSIVVTGTDTDVGKTVFSAALTQALDADYWKPIQAGNDDGTDSIRVMKFGVPADRILPEQYRLATPASPHLAARLDNVRIDTHSLDVPEHGDRSLVIEGAGGLMVPLNENTLFIDIFARWGLPVVLCARTALGTINHSLLSIEALKTRHIPVLGIAFIGDENSESERIICTVGGVRRLGRLPWLSPLTPQTLQAAFAKQFDVADFFA
ncbi:MAG: dethiobiotin synthase [Xanthobacteraceae bacterium]|nr:dethiobiotin synthase [Xanthobacteraceae bacterium]